MANMATGKMMKETFLFLSLKPCSFHVRDYWFVGIKIAWNNFQFYFLKLLWHQMRKLFKGLIFPWNALTQPMANRLKLLGIPYLIGKISRLNFYFMVRNGRVRKKLTSTMTPYLKRNQTSSKLGLHLFGGFIVPQKPFWVEYVEILFLGDVPKIINRQVKLSSETEW